MAYYIAPSFLNKLAVHITKNYLDLPQVKVPLILGIHGRKGEGKTFQCELAFEKMGVEVVHISGGELESPDAGDPARLIRLRYREAAELVRVRGCMAVLMINDLDAGAGRFDRMTQYTVNTQLVNNTLMNIADKPTNVQLPGSYDEKPLPRIPIIATGNDFATLYAPLIRDGRMQKFYWEPSYEDRLGIIGGMFESDGVSAADVEVLVTEFDDQAIDFFGAVRSQLYDEQITCFIHSVGIENIASNVVNTIKTPTFDKPNFRLERLVEAGKLLVQEQDRVRTMGLVSEYNQAVTPAGGSSYGSGYGSVPPLRKDTALLTVPRHNPLTPYTSNPAQDHTNHRKGLGKRDAQAAEIERRAVGRSFKEMVRDSATESSSNSYSSRATSHSGRTSASTESAQPFETVVSNILGQGHRLGIEHVDQRRFRVNSWQSYATLDTTSQLQALEALKSCIQDFPDHYIRLISIDRHSNRRINESVIRRPV